MSKVCFVCFALMVALALCGLATETETADVQAETVRVLLELKCGSSILGVPLAEKLSFSVLYGWELDIPFESITSLAFPQDTTNAVLRLQNADQLTVQVRDPSVKFETLLGVIDVRMSSIVSMLVVTSQVVLAPELREGLLAFYPFTVNEGDVCSDQSGKERDGKVVNAQWTADGKVGGAMRFDPDVIRSYIVALDEGLPAGDSPRSAAFWMKLASVDTLAYAISYGTMNLNKASNLVFDHRLGRNSMGFSPNGIINVAQKKMQADCWYHVVYTYGGENDHKFYVDGVRDNLHVRETRGSIQTELSGGLYLGTRADNVGHGFDGWLDEVLIYDRELSADEARQLYERR